MDRNTIIGLAIIGLLLVGYSIFTKPAREAQMAERQRLDSIARAQQIRDMAAAQYQDTVQPSPGTEAQTGMDSVYARRLDEELGDFASSATGTEKKVVLENEQLKLTFSTLGGRPYTARLKEFQTHDSLPLILFDGDSTIFALQFFADNRSINTGELFFEPTITKATDDQGRTFQQLVMKMEISESSFISYIYKLYDGDYMLDFDMRLKGLDRYRTDRMEFKFDFYAPSQEKGYQNEGMYTTLYYKFQGGDVESFKSRSKKEIEEVTETTRIRWIAFSQQFFSTILVADDYFSGAYLSQHRFNEPGKYIRQFEASVDMPFDRTSDQVIGMQLYLGPNKFHFTKGLWGRSWAGECGYSGWGDDPLDQCFCGDPHLQLARQLDHQFRDHHPFAHINYQNGPVPAHLPLL
jgi:YidC/Oxa1 family membrane protein insertase